MIALINAQRKLAGKGALGLLGPLIYSAPPSTWIDVTSGNNKCTERCCSDYGFLAQKGYDLSTGFGSIHFPSLSAHLMQQD